MNITTKNTVHIKSSSGDQAGFYRGGTTLTSSQVKLGSIPPLANVSANLQNLNRKPGSVKISTVRINRPRIKSAKSGCGCVTSRGTKDTRRSVHDDGGLSPCSYYPRNKPLSETNAPMWSFGRRSFVEKDGGARTAWGKTWFQSQDVWRQKTDFFQDRTWPSPPHYTQPPSLGPRQVTHPGYPAHSCGQRRPIKNKTDAEPAPNQYQPGRATWRHQPAFSHGHRRGGTILWPSTEGYNTPGPGAYEPHIRTSKVNHPAFTIRSGRRERVHNLGPFAAF